MTNESGIHPKGHRILVLPNQIEEKSAGGIILGTSSQMGREALAQMYGVVIEMGNTCFSDQPEPWCEVGDRVSFGKYSGLIYTGVDGKTYRVVNDLDVVAKVEEGVK